MAIHEMFTYICVKNAGKAIDFYKAAFGATEKFRLTEPSGRIGHAELLFGKDTLMLADEFPEMNFHAPAADGPRVLVIHLHVDNADEALAQPSKPARNWCAPPRTSSTANAPAPCATRSATTGCSATRSKRSSRRRCSGGTMR